uniref:Putative secreted protein n=1 Tax=Xenopsylla cheopis TaxID=163159 RepID=A0A6M2DZX7_XENCH
MKILSVCLTFLILIIAVCCARVMENMDNYPRSRYGSMDFSNDLDGDFNKIDDLDSHIFAPKINPISPLTRDPKTNHHLVEKTVSGIFAPEFAANRRRVEKSLHYKRKWEKHENLESVLGNEIEDTKYDVKINFEDDY